MRISKQEKAFKHLLHTSRNIDRYFQDQMFYIISSIINSYRMTIINHSFE
jgi:hypothetical protein